MLCSPRPFNSEWHQVILHAPKIRQRVERVAFRLQTRTQFQGETVPAFSLEPGHQLSPQFRQVRVVGNQIIGLVQDDLGRGQIAGIHGGTCLLAESGGEPRVCEDRIIGIEQTNGDRIR